MNWWLNWGREVDGNYETTNMTDERDEELTLHIKGSHCNVTNEQ